MGGAAGADFPFSALSQKPVCPRGLLQAALRWHCARWSPPALWTAPLCAAAACSAASVLASMPCRHKTEGLSLPAVSSQLSEAMANWRVQQLSDIKAAKGP